MCFEETQVQCCESFRPSPFMLQPQSENRHVAVVAELPLRAPTALRNPTLDPQVLKSGNLINLWSCRWGSGRP